MYAVKNPGKCVLYYYAHVLFYITKIIKSSTSDGGLCVPTTHTRDA